MEKYRATVSIEGTYEMEVMANNEEEAIENANENLDFINCGDIVVDNIEVEYADEMNDE